MLDVTKLADRQLRDYDAHNPGTIFAEPISLDLLDAYAIQTEVCRLREHRGERLIGYKVGCTSTVIREQLGIDHSVYGRLFAVDSWESPASLASAQFSNAAIEGELAVRLARDLPVGASAEESLSMIDSIFTVIEMHNLVFRRQRPSVEELVTNNCVHAGFVYPAALPQAVWDDSSSLQIEIDGEPVATVSGAEMLRTIAESLRWLTRQLQPHGLGLLAGHTILCGSVAQVIPVSAGSQISAQAGSYGSVACTIS